MIIWGVIQVLVGVLMIVFRSRIADFYQRFHREQFIGGGEFYASRSTSGAVLFTGVVLILSGTTGVLMGLGMFSWPWE